MRDLKRELLAARVRLEICFGRMQACHQKNPEEHQVSMLELPAWIEEMKELENEDLHQEDVPLR